MAIRKNFKPDPGRRNFIKKLNLLGAIAVTGNRSQPVSARSSLDEDSSTNFMEYAGNVNPWPRIILKKNSTLSRNNGPNLANLYCRLDVPVTGNIKFFQIMGSGAETQFVQAVHATESFVFYKDQFYALAESDQIVFEYSLSYITVVYKNNALPFFVTKKIFLHPDYVSCLQHITIKNVSKQNFEIYFIEKAAFTFGDPLYTTYTAFARDNYSGLKVGNELSRSYVGRFLMSGTDVTKIFTRNDQLEYQMKTVKTPWQHDENVYKNCDDQSGLLQKRLKISSGGSDNDFIISFSAGAASNEAAHGTAEIFTAFQKDRLHELETALHKRAMEFAMVSTPNQFLNQGFAISNKVSSQVFQSADGLVALPGHMYPSFYSRDSHWQIRGLLAGGRFKEVKALLSHFTKYQHEEGSFPTRISLQGKPIYHTGVPDLDSAALISLSIIEYVRWSGDTDFGLQNWKSITASIDFLKTKDTDNDGWIEQDYNQDWADRTKRHGKVNYTQCIYFQLLKEAAELGEFLNKPEVGSYRQIVARLKTGYDQLFWDEEAGFYIDYITPDGRRMKKMSQDVCLAFIFGLSDDRKKIQRHLAKLKEKCWSKWGPKHHEGYVDGNTYDPLGFYCNGGVWMWLTAFEAYAHFQFGDPEDGVTVLNAIKEYEFGKNPYNEVYFDTTEWHDSINGLNCEYDWKECRNFTTGSGSHVWAIICGLYGLQISMKGIITWNPRFPASWRHKDVTLNNIRIGNNTLHKVFRFKDEWQPT